MMFDMRLADIGWIVDYHYINLSSFFFFLFSLLIIISTEIKNLPGSGLEQPHRFVGAYRFSEIANPLIDN
jgi:hypothetical protein